jgi:hypothetical protein
MSSLLSELLFGLPVRAICRWPPIMAVRDAHAEAEWRHAERNYC